MVLCTGGGGGGFLGGGGMGGSPTILSIYKKGAYKNLQGDSSVFPKNPELRPLG